DVPAIARQLLARLGLGRRGARLGELAGNAPQLHHLRMAAEGEDQRHLQEQLKIVADVVGLMLLEAFGAVAALQQKSATRRHRGVLGREVAHLLDEDERREVAQMALPLLECPLTRVLRDREDRLAPPVIYPPRLSHTWYSAFIAPAAPPVEGRAGQGRAVRHC